MLWFLDRYIVLVELQGPVYQMYLYDNGQGAFRLPTISFRIEALAFQWLSFTVARKLLTLGCILNAKYKTNTNIFFTISEHECNLALIWDTKHETKVSLL